MCRKGPAGEGKQSEAEMLAKFPFEARLVGQACNLGMAEMKAEGSIQDQSQLHSKSEAILGYMTHYLSNTLYQKFYFKFIFQTFH